MREFLCIYFFLSTILSFGQNSNRIDSLRHLSNKTSGSEKAKILMKIATELENKDYDEAISTIDDALQLLETEVDGLSYGQALQIKGNIYLVNGNLVKADSLFREAKNRYLKNNDAVAIAALNVDRARVFANQRNLDEALRLGENALPILRENNKTDKELTALNLIAGIYYYKAEYDKSLQIMERILDIYPNKDDKYVGIVLNTGSIHFVKSNFVKALSLYQEGLSISEDNNAINHIAKAHDLIGELHKERKRYDAALKAHQKALTIYKEAGLKSNQVSVLQNMGASLTALHRFVEADGHLQESLNLASEIQNKLQVAKSRALIGINSLRLGNPRDGIVDLTSSIAYLENAKANTHLVQAYNALAECYYGIENFGKSINYGKKTLELTETTSYPEARLEALFILSESYRQKGSFQRAYEYLSKFTELSDSTNKKQQDLVVEELNSKFDVERREEQIELLQKENVARNLVVDSQRRTIQVIGIALTIFLLLIFLLYRNYRLKAKANEQLKIRNKEKNQLLKDRETLVKEIHHRVNNNLQVISSVLQLQYKRTNNESAQEIIQGIMSRVQSMAEIHKDLFAKNQLHRLDMNAFFDRLVKNNLNLFGTKSEVKCTIDTMVSAPLKDAVPIGLIANELVTNSLKHAFPQNTKGIIRIKLGQNQEHYHLIVEDNGSGFTTARPESSLGLEIVEILVNQLKGEIKMSFNIGTTASIKLKKYQS